MFIDKRAQIGKNVIIYENNRIDGESVIEDNVTIYPNCFISNSIIGKGSKIYSSIIENSQLGACVSVGGFCKISKSEVGNNVKIGEFCVVRKEKILSNLKIHPHSCVLKQ